jgi:hypothetical protein
VKAAAAYERSKLNTAKPFNRSTNQLVRDFFFGSAGDEGIGQK